MRHDLVSVVMPVFNAERTVAEALASVLAQTYDRLEVIVIDDGSTDASAQVLAEHARRDGRVSIVSTENRGATVALNTGLAAARGGLIARMDADDICEPARIERQVAHLGQHKGCVAVGSLVTTIDSQGRQRSKQRARGVRLKDRCQDFRSFPPSPPTIFHPTAVIRSAALGAIGGYRSCFRSAQDRDLWWRLSRLGEIHRLPEPLLRYRVHADSVSHRYRDRTIADALICDLAAVAAHFGADDSDLLQEYGSARMASATIDRYAELLGGRYPVLRLARFWAITRRCPALVGYRDRASMMRYAIGQLLRSPFRRKYYRLAAAALSQPMGATQPQAPGVP